MKLHTHRSVAATFILAIFITAVFVILPAFVRPIATDVGVTADTPNMWLVITDQRSVPAPDHTCILGTRIVRFGYPFVAFSDQNGGCGFQLTMINPIWLGIDVFIPLAVSYVAVIISRLLMRKRHNSL